MPPAQSTSSRGYFALMFLFTVAVVSVWLYINRDNIREYSETHQSREQARQKIAETKELIAALKRQQQSLNYNGLESKKQMRERLQMHLPGEQVVYFEKESTTTNTRHTTRPAAAPLRTQ